MDLERPAAVGVVGTGWEELSHPMTRNLVGLGLFALLVTVKGNSYVVKNRSCEVKSTS
jgi:hypothetical protein